MNLDPYIINDLVANKLMKQFRECPVCKTFLQLLPMGDVSGDSGVGFADTVFENSTL